MTSQFLAIFFLNDLDHYIKEELRCKYYIRYMDDFIIIDIDKNRLKEVWKLIEKELNNLKLNINPKSTITSLNTGITFLGYKYKLENNKFKFSYRKKTIRKIKKKLRILEKYDLMKYYKSYGSYYGYLKKVKTWERNFTMKTIEKYDYFKDKHKRELVLVKVGGFYKKYRDDAKILWSLFDYKWNNSSIGFGINNSSKIFDKIKKQGLGYIVIESDSDTVMVKGNDIIYDSYLNISLIKYDIFEKKNKINQLIDKLIDGNNEKADAILKYLESMQEGDGKSD